MWPDPWLTACVPQALEYLFKFIVQSRILYSRATCGMEEEQFRASIQELFQSIRFVLSLDSRSSENLVFTQVRQMNVTCLSLSSFINVFDVFHLFIFTVWVQVSLIYYFINLFLISLSWLVPPFCSVHLLIGALTPRPPCCPILGLLLDSLGVWPAACLSVVTLKGSRPSQ